MTDNPHFASRTPDDHVRFIRERHGLCLGEPHRTHRGFLYHLTCDTILLGSFLFFLRTLFFIYPAPYGLRVTTCLSIGLGWVFYLGCMQARKAWAHMELSHRFMLEEKYEVDNNPEGERLELTSIYSSQGFKEPLLSEMVQFVSSDSTLLLETMLREELQLRLEEFPHPLTQGGTRLLGGLIGLGLFLPLVCCASYTIAGVLSASLITCLSVIKAKILGNNPIVEAVWSLGIFLTSISISLI